MVFILNVRWRGPSALIFSGKSITLGVAQGWYGLGRWYFGDIDRFAVVCFFISVFLRALRGELVELNID